MKIFYILLIFLFAAIKNDNENLKKEVQIVGPFNKLMNFNFVQQDNKLIKVKWEDLAKIAIANKSSTQNVQDESVSSSTCFDNLIKKFQNKTLKVTSAIDQDETKQLMECIKKNKKSTNNNDIEIKNDKDDKQLKLYQYQPVTLLQNKLRFVLKSFDLISGITLDQENIEQDEINQYTIQGQSDILSECLDSLKEDASGNKMKVIQKMMVSSIVLKKVWQLMNTIGGIDLFHCPEPVEEKVFGNMKTNPLFTEKLIDLDLVSQEIFKSQNEEQNKNKYEKIQKLKEDYNNNYTTEHYKPLEELNLEVENFANNSITIKDSYDLPDPLAQLYSVQTRHEYVSKYCDATMFKQFPIIIPKVKVDMFALQKEPFRLIFDVKRGYKENKNDDDSEFQSFRPETKILTVVQEMIRKAQKTKNEENEAFINELQNNIELIRKNLKLGGVDTTVKKVIFTQKDYDAIKQINDVKKIVNERQKSKHFLYRQYTYFDVESKNLLKYLLDPNYLIQEIIKKFDVDDNSEWLEETEYKSHIQIARVKALYVLNYSRLLNHFFTYLKFSPLVVPDSYDYYKMHEENVNKYKDIQEKEAKKSYFKRPEGKISDLIVNDKAKPEETTEEFADKLHFKSAADLTQNLSQNPFNRTASKEHIVYQTFMYFLDDYLKEFVSKDSSMAQCLIPSGRMKKGSQCPIFFQDLMKFISQNQKLQPDFTSVYGLFISLFESNPNDIKQTIETLLNQMLIFSRFQYNKILFEQGDTIDQLIRKKVYDELPNDLRIIDEKKRIFFEDFYFEIYIYFLGIFVPEFSQYYKNYFFFKYSKKAKVQDLLNEMNNDYVSNNIEDLAQEQEIQASDERKLFQSNQENHYNLI